MNAGFDDTYDDLFNERPEFEDRAGADAHEEVAPDGVAPETQHVLKATNLHFLAA